MEIQVTCMDGEKRSVRAYKTASPQLAAHLRRSGASGLPIRGCWDVTHIPTGLRVTTYPFYSRSVAKDFAAHLADLDWNFDDQKKVPGDRFKEMGAAVSRAREAVRG